MALVSSYLAALNKYHLFSKQEDPPLLNFQYMSIIAWTGRTKIVLIRVTIHDVVITMCHLIENV